MRKDLFGKIRRKSLLRELQKNLWEKSHDSMLEKAGKDAFLNNFLSRLEELSLGRVTEGFYKEIG